MRRVIGAYDAPIVRGYSWARFLIININILHILRLCLRGQHRILDIGCGFGLFGCYFASVDPEITYQGYDLDPARVDMARLAARRLGLSNVRFDCADVRRLRLDEQFDAIFTIDLMHHLDDAAKVRVLAECAAHLGPTGRLVIKDVTTHPAYKLAFTWVLDVLMTRSLDMWYWSDERFCALLGQSFSRVDTFPIADWLPYPHIVYLCDNT